MSTRPRLSEWESTWAFVAGGGLLLIILAFGLAAMRGSDNGGALNGMLLIGALLLVGGTIGWLVQFRPWTKFDDWSTPLFTGHDDHAAHGDQGVHGAAVVEAHAHGVDQPAETHVTEPDTAHADVSGVNIDAHLPQIFHESKVTYNETTPPLPPPPEIMDPMTAFPPVDPATERNAAPGPVTHVESDVIEPVPLDPEVPHDNLQMLEGIGPKIAGALNAAGIYTFAELAKRQPPELEKIVRDANVRMVGHGESWPKQAEMAVRGDMAALKAYQETLRSGQNV